MNTKKVLGSVAALAATAAVVGGGTFASWSDSYTDAGNNVGADKLELSVTDPSAVQEFDKINMYPGGQADYEFLITSREGDAVPNAGLTLNVEDLLGNEDGCTNTNGENDAEVLQALAQGCNTPGEDPDELTNLFGQFDDETTVVVNASSPMDAADLAAGGYANHCAAPAGNRLTGTGISSLRDLADYGDLNLLPAATTLAPGEGICVRMAVGLPIGASDASQGDSASFDARFDLVQAP